MHSGDDMLEITALLDHDAKIDADVSLGVPLPDEDVSKIIKKRNDLRFRYRAVDDPKEKEKIENSISYHEKHLKALDKTLPNIKVSPKNADKKSGAVSEYVERC